nr:hypothetical protein [Paraburkholderia flava]
MHLARPRRNLATRVAAIALLAIAASAHAAEPRRYAFAVIGGTMHSPADEAPTQRLIDAIGRDPQMSFIVYDGNLKSAKEACRDSLYERRQALFEASRPALVFIPGQHDWTDCGTAAAGGFDPVERLDLLRQTLFSESESMGQNPLTLTRESEVSRFRPYRENVRWQVGDTVFIGLNAPGPNNHYLNAGGRNGEFEDRVIANGFWLEHAAEYAKRRDARAIVVFMQGDPDPERYERPERFAWLRFGRNARRDGYLEFKRSLVKLAQTFRGPVLLIHENDEPLAGGFLIDQPLRNDKGALVTNLTRIAFAPRDRLSEWVQVDVDLARRPPFRVIVREVPKNLPVPPAIQPPSPPHEEPMLPPMPEVPGLPGVPPASEVAPLDVPPILQSPGEASGASSSSSASSSGNSPSNAASGISPLPPLSPHPASSVQRGP